MTGRAGTAKCPFADSFTMLFWTRQPKHTSLKQEKGEGEERERHIGWHSLMSIYRKLEANGCLQHKADPLPPVTTGRHTNYGKCYSTAQRKPAALSYWTWSLKSFWIHLFVCLDFFSLLPWRWMLNNYHGQKFQLSCKWIYPAVTALARKSISDIKLTLFSANNSQYSQYFSKNKRTLSSGR